MVATVKAISTVYNGRPSTAIGSNERSKAIHFTDERIANETTEAARPVSAPIAEFPSVPNKKPKKSSIIGDMLYNTEIHPPGPAAFRITIVEQSNFAEILSAPFHHSKALFNATLKEAATKGRETYNQAIHQKSLKEHGVLAMAAKRSEPGNCIFQDGNEL